MRSRISAWLVLVGCNDYELTGETEGLGLGDSASANEESPLEEIDTDLPDTDLVDTEIDSDLVDPCVGHEPKRFVATRWGTEVDGVAPDLYLFETRGDGSFEPHLAFTRSGAFTYKLGDFDNDTRVDIVLRDEDGALSMARWDYDESCEIVWSETPAGSTETPFHSGGDYDGDGNLDLLYLDRPTGAITTYRGTGDGTFEPVSGGNTGLVVTGTLSAMLQQAADFDEDGCMDTAMATWTETWSVPSDHYWLRGRCDGTFDPAVKFATVDYPVHHGDGGDVDGDGHGDIVWGSDDDGDAGLVWFVRGHGDGTFDAPAAVYDWCPEAEDTVNGCGGGARLFDWDEDGDLDVVVGASVDHVDGNKHFFSFENEGALSLELVWDYDTGAIPSAYIEVPFY